MADTAAAPAAPVTAPAPAAPKPVSELVSRHMLADDAFLEGLADDAFADESPAEPEAPPARTKSKRDPEPNDEPEGEEPEDEVAEEAGEEEPAEAEEEEPEEPASTKGTKEDPLTIKEVPEDQYLELKIDGEKVVVSLREAVEGAYLRPKAFDRLVSKANAAKVAAEEIAQAAVDGQEQMKSSFEGLIANPDHLFKLMLNRHEDVLEAVAIRFAELRMQEKQDPTLRQKRVFEAQQRAIEMERQRVAQERQEWESRRQAEQQTQEALKALKPGYEAGLKRAGFPVMTPELAKETRVRLELVRREQGYVTAEDVEEAIVKAARILGGPAKPGVAKAKPAAAPATARVAPPKPAPVQARKPADGKKDWSAVPQNKKWNNIDWWLSGAD